MMTPEETAKAVKVKDAAMDKFMADAIGADFYRDLTTEIQALHTDPEEKTLEDLPEDMLEFVNGLEIQDEENPEA